MYTNLCIMVDIFRLMYVNKTTIIKLVFLKSFFARYVELKLLLNSL